MARFTFACAVLLSYYSLGLSAALPTVASIAGPATMPDTPVPDTLELPELPLLHHYNNNTASPAVPNSQSALEKQAQRRDDKPQPPDKMADLLNDPIVDGAIRQIIWKNETVGFDNLFNPKKSIIPSVLGILNDTEAVLRELIPFVDTLGTISVETGSMWRDMRSGYESWALGMRDAYPEKTVTNITTLVPAELEYQLQPEHARPLLKAAIQLGAHEHINAADAASRMDILENALRDWEAVADTIFPLSSHSVPTDEQRRQLTAAARMETAYNRTEQTVRDNMQWQNTTQHNSTAWIRGELGRFTALLDDQISRLHRQRTWYAEQVAAAGNTTLAGAGYSGYGDDGREGAGAKLQRTFETVDGWLAGARRRGPDVVVKVLPHIRKVEILLRDRQIRQSGRLAGWRVVMRKRLVRIQEAREAIEEFYEASKVDLDEED